MPVPVLDPDLAVGLYLVDAAVAGAIIGWPGVPQVIMWGVVLVGGVGATLYRRRVLHEKGWTPTEVQWLAVFGSVWVGVQLITHSGWFAG